MDVVHFQWRVATAAAWRATLMPQGNFTTFAGLDCKKRQRIPAKTGKAGYTCP
jgi:hypothetical protein